jgi:hypothetical protein
MLGFRSGTWLIFFPCVSPLNSNNTKPEERIQQPQRICYDNDLVVCEASGPKISNRLLR